MPDDHNRKTRRREWQHDIPVDTHQTAAIDAGCFDNFFFDRPDRPVIYRPQPQPGATAFAFPYAPRSEVRITILYDRVLGPVVGDLNVGATLLGHVLAHEITHVLQAVTRHSQEGVMKAQWTPEDRMQMRKGPLPFTPGLELCGTVDQLGPESGDRLRPGQRVMALPTRPYGPLADALVRLADDPDLRERLGRAGRRRVLEHFDQRRQCERLEEIYAAVQSRESAS